MSGKTCGCHKRKLSLVSFSETDALSDDLSVIEEEEDPSDIASRLGDGGGFRF
jgi:hypothetical protein